MFVTREPQKTMKTPLPFPTLPLANDAHLGTNTGNVFLKEKDDLIHDIADITLLSIVRSNNFHIIKSKSE